MNKVASLILSFLVCFTVVPWNGFAFQNAPVKGTVTDSRGNPIANATVVATDDQGNVAGTATTNAQGQYSMALPVGTKYTFKLDPPPPFEKPLVGVAQPMLASSGAVVNLTLQDKGGQALLAIGAGALFALPPGLAVGFGGGKKKSISTSSE